MHSEIKDYTHLNVEALRDKDIVIHNEEITARTKELALDIAERYRGQDILLVSLLNGATPFTILLGQELHELGIDVEMDTMKVSSYGLGTESQGVKIEKDMSEDPRGRNVLVVDDIADTLHTFAAVANHLQDKGLGSFATVSLLEKPSKREVDFPLDFVGFRIPNIWVEGFGMDSARKGRFNKNIIYRVPPKAPPV